MRRALLLLAVVAAGVAAWAGYHAWRRAHPGLVDLDTAWQQVREEPRDPLAWAGLADAQTTMDQTEAAEQSYRTALRLGGDQPDLLGRLGFLLYAQGRDREAYALLREARDRGAELPLLGTTVAQLEERLAPVEIVVTGPEPEELERKDASQERVCTVPVRRAHAFGTFLVETRIAGEPATLVVDTGASITALARELVDHLGIAIDARRAVHAITATGPASFPTATVSELEVAGERVAGLRVAVCDGCGGRDASGLLGLDVQAALGLELDIHASVLRFVDCD
jgi:predicted aspartyl protease